MNMNGKATIVISPYRAANGRTRRQHAQRAEALCILLARAGVPTFASHLYATQFLNEDDPAEREAGIAISKCWIARADRLAVWDPWGISEGMAAEIAWAEVLNRGWKAGGGLPAPLIHAPIQIHYFTSAEVPEWSGTFTREGGFR
jgi:hypothetical protein